MGDFQQRQSSSVGRVPLFFALTICQEIAFLLQILSLHAHAQVIDTGANFMVLTSPFNSCDDSRTVTVIVDDSTKMAKK